MAEWTIENAAAVLNGGQYRNETTREQEAQLKNSGLVAIFGGSDDLVYIAGDGFGSYTCEEMGAGEGKVLLFSKRGLYQAECEDYDCPHEKRLRKNLTKVTCHWGRDGFSWTYSTEIPHATFEVREGSEPYCRGIVFSLAQVPAE